GWPDAIPCPPQCQATPKARNAHVALLDVGISGRQADWMPHRPGHTLRAGARGRTFREPVDGLSPESRHVILPNEERSERNRRSQIDSKIVSCQVEETVTRLDWRGLCFGWTAQAELDSKD